ncbi:MAG: hypothetical protein FJZ60_00330 [Chlamydiae bacterium]|nr:hypothetical protein [Chlamydiota bacterium]
MNVHIVWINPEEGVGICTTCSCVCSSSSLQPDILEEKIHIIALRNSYLSVDFKTIQKFEFWIRCCSSCNRGCTYTIYPVVVTDGL